MDLVSMLPLGSLSVTDVVNKKLSLFGHLTFPIYFFCILIKSSRSDLQLVDAIWNLY